MHLSMRLAISPFRIEAASQLQLPPCRQKLMLQVMA